MSPTKISIAVILFVIVSATITNALTVNFDDKPSGITVTTINGITFSSNVTEYSQIVSNIFATSTLPNSLGVNDGRYQVFLPGETITLTFAAPVTSISVKFVSSQLTPANAYSITTPVGSSQSAAMPESILADGSEVYAVTFSSTTPFSTAILGTNFEEIYSFNIDDINITTLVHGVCGTDNGLSLTTGPTNLCADNTTPTAVTGSGPWYWTCSGLYGGTDASCSANLADTTLPIISVFSIPSSSSSPSVSVSLTATDNSGTISAYCLTETNNSATCNWTTLKPTAYTFATAGVKTLYVFVKDPTGNVSIPASVSTVIGLSLTITISGDGSGAVNSNPAGITCSSGISSGCDIQFLSSASLTLSATPSANSLFANWSGACTGNGDCPLTMDSAKTVTATFTAAPRAMIGTTGYTTIQNAYNSATSGAVIKLLEGTQTENITFGRNISVFLEGGYYASYSGINSETKINGKLQLRSGTVRMKRVNVK